MLLQRDKEGHFLESEESLSRKTIGLRIGKTRLKKLEAIATLTGKSVTEIARDAVHKYLDEFQININPEK